MTDRGRNKELEAVLPLIVIVTGPTCSGKTTLAHALCERFGLPLFHKDGFKETMFDIALSAVSQIPDGEVTRDFSRLLGRFSLGCLEVALRQCARSGTDAVFEANFDSRLFSPRLSAIRQVQPFRVVQVHLRYIGRWQDDTARELGLLTRFSSRERTDRHPGHGAWRRGLEESEEHIMGLPKGFGRELLRLHDGDQPLQTEEGDGLIEIDTADFAAVDFESLFDTIQQRLTSGRNRASLSPDFSARQAIGKRATLADE